jgi:hypothetical protein
MVSSRLALVLVALGAALALSTGDLQGQWSGQFTTDMAYKADGTPVCLPNGVPSAVSLNVSGLLFSVNAAAVAASSTAKTRGFSGAFRIMDISSSAQVLLEQVFPTSATPICMTVTLFRPTHYGIKTMFTANVGTAPKVCPPLVNEHTCAIGAGYAVNFLQLSQSSSSPGIVFCAKTQAACDKFASEFALDCSLNPENNQWCC